MQIKTATQDARIHNIEDLSNERTGSLYVVVDCDVGTPQEAVTTVLADFLSDAIIEEIAHGTRRRYGAFLCGWVYTVRAWRKGARSEIATGCLASIAA